MDRQRNGLAGAMRDIAERRDNLLRNADVISDQRREQLSAFLAAEHPVETALLAAARRRDESCTMAGRALPAAVHAALVEEARSARAAVWPRSFSAGYAIAAAAAVIIAATALHLFRPDTRAIESPSASRSMSLQNLGPAAFTNVSIFQRPGEHLTSRVNRLELASLEPSLLTINRALPEFERADRVLPLDLPIRQIRLDVEAVRTP
jgi:dsDNA-binding SOS-regulon protein